MDWRAPRRAVEAGVAVAEDSAVGGHQPVPPPSGVAAMPTTGLLSGEPRRAVEARVAVAEDPAVGGHQPVPTPVGGGYHADDGLVERRAPRRAVEAGVAVTEDSAVGGHQPVAPAVGVAAVPTTGLWSVMPPGAGPGGEAGGAGMVLPVQPAVWRNSCRFTCVASTLMAR